MIVHWKNKKNTCKIFKIQQLFSIKKLTNLVLMLLSWAFLQRKINFKNKSINPKKEFNYLIHNNKVKAVKVSFKNAKKEEVSSQKN